MSLWVLLFLLTVIAVVSGIAAIYGRRCVHLQRDLDHANDRRREIANFLTRFSTGLQSEEGVAGAMHAAAHHVAEQTDAESVAIYEMTDAGLQAVGVCGAYPLIHSTNRLLFSKHHHLFAALSREIIREGQGFLGQVAAERHALLVADASKDERFAEYPDHAGLHSVMAIPLLRDGTLIGLVCAATSRRSPRMPFTQQQFERLKLLAQQVIMVSNLVHVYGEISRRERLDQELGFARQLQMSLLPPPFPAWGNFTVDAYTRSAKEVDGDFYDFVEIDEDRLLIIIGDACGKGIPACMLTAMTRSFIRSMIDNFTTLSDLLRDLNDKLNRDTDADRFITVGCCLLDRKNNTVEFGRAGHTDLICFVHDHLRLFSPDGTALGILPSEFASFDTICLSFEPGTTFLMFSDGLSEAINKESEEFGIERLKQTFAQACRSGLSPQKIIDQLINTVMAYEVEQADDQTVVLIRHNENECVTR